MITIFHTTILAHMKPQTEAQNAEMSADSEIEDFDDQLVSKSQLKRDSKDLQKLGKQLASYNPAQLARVPLNETLLDAILLAQKLSNKRSALKRHYQFVGKILRSIDVTPILDAVAIIENDDESSKKLFKTLENWRNRILEHGETAIHECCDMHPQVDRQRLRQLNRNYRQAPSEEKKTHIARQIYKELSVSLKDE